MSSIAARPEAIPAGLAVRLDRHLSPADLAAVAEGRARLVLAPEAEALLARARERLTGAVERGALVYGLTTGFGPLADRPVAASEAAALQAGLIDHLASGVGRPLGWAAARAVLLARLRALLEGVSGAAPETVRLMAAVLEAGLAPEIPEKGTVGASGDLTPLAHVALALLGRGRFLGADGQALGAEAAFARIGRPPLDLAARDGLAIVNGTSAMTGLACLNSVAASRLIGWSLRLTAGLGDLLAARVEAWHPALVAAKPHPGQIRAAGALRRAIAGSARAYPGPVAVAPAGDGRAPQDAYTLRCAPQILGAALDALDWHDRTVEIELNGASDNPILPDPDTDPGAPEILHGGNFMGQHVAFAADALSQAVIAVAGLAERQVARLTDERLSGGFPPFLLRGRAGLASGLMGAQVTATALHAEMRARAVPASIQSISTNAANQDVVSMGTIAARKTGEHLEDAWRVLAILAIAVAQGADIVEAGEAGPGPAALAPATAALAAEIRRFSPPLLGDRPLSGEIEAVARRLAEGPPPPLDKEG